MTDNVVKAGIEDVLSSVKRLVTEEGKASKGADRGTGARKPGRLVLTDALRISKPVMAEETPLKLEPEYSAADSAKPMLLRACDIVRDDAGDDQDSNEDSPAVSKTEPADEDPTISLSAKIEALEAAIARTEDQWEPDGDSDDAYSGTPNRSLHWDSEAAFAEENSVDTPDEQTDVAQPQNVHFTAESEGPEVEAPEGAVSEAEEAEPATFIRSAEAVPASEQDAVQHREVTADEEALREMIAEVVQQELKGALGERITRNVRKMVRREIYRALAAQELE